MKTKVFLYCILASICLMVITRMQDRAKANPINSKTPPVSLKADTSLKHHVAFIAKDSTVINEVKHTVQLYGKATFKYNGLEIKADYIVFNQQSCTGSAKGHVSISPASAGIKNATREVKFCY